MFNNETKLCQALPPCLANQYYNKVTKKCENITFLTAPSTPNLIYAYNFTEYEKQYNAKKLSDPNAKDCSNELPFSDRKANVCVKCPSDRQYFNLHTNLCQDCGSASYDATKRQCNSNSAVTVDPTLERLIMNIL